ncbi:hypothetical protein Cylst_3085 [Cylindrospermum stagnale PCC 7417]|uniref:Uncharacterized protein n=1 Tax=Cylindrospermum stagnale PCC 7417 TaxID=56107 RepID=K9WY12_9NOST|nr:hypothetical protein Cylst_3085 [Cylindrospermum stagnale PCC 7417]
MNREGEKIANEEGKRRRKEILSRFVLLLYLTYEVLLFHVTKFNDLTK